VTSLNPGVSCTFLPSPSSSPAVRIARSRRGKALCDVGPWRPTRAPARNPHDPLRFRGIRHSREIGRGGVLFRFYMGSAPTFVSFCCNPSSILSSPPRIARSRRGEAKWGIGTRSGADLENRIRLICRKFQSDRRKPRAAPIGELPQPLSFLDFSPLPVPFAGRADR